MSKPPESQRVTELLNDHDKKINEGRNLITRLWRKILHSRRMSIAQWSKQMSLYLNDPINNIGSNPKRISQARNNLQKEILKDNMTWNNFEKAIKFIGAVKMRIRIDLHYPNGKVHHHEEEIYFGNQQPQDDDEGIEDEDKDSLL